MYRLGFRALEEVAEASVEELHTIDGVSAVGGAEALKENAVQTMERLRAERFEEIRTRKEPPTERELLRLVRGVGLRTLQFLEEGGYRSLRDLLREDPDRLAIKSGLSNRKARAIQQHARHFIEHELVHLEHERRALRDQAAHESREQARAAQAPRSVSGDASESEAESKAVRAEEAGVEAESASEAQA
jgi:transcription termination/antitermination protein NusA